jgi:hypothetical protein
MNENMIELQNNLLEEVNIAASVFGYVALLWQPIIFSRRGRMDSPIQESN